MRRPWRSRWAASSRRETERGRDAPHTAALEQSALGVEMGGVAPVAGSEERLLAVATRARDYTGPEHITLVITDLGAWAPSAVSEELIMLYS